MGSGSKPEASRDAQSVGGVLMNVWVYDAEGVALEYPLQTGARRLGWNHLALNESFHVAAWFIGEKAMRSILAVGLLVTLYGSANAATVHPTP
jgi:hypothetical protein